MCNSFLQIDNSTTSFEETRKLFMFCFCHGHFGTLVSLTISILFIFIGTPIHCYSLWLFIRGNIKSNLVIPLNVTLVDLAFCIQSCGELTATFISTEESYKWAFFFATLCWTVRPLLQICMCLEHYLAVIHPVMFLRYKDIQYRIALVIAVWLIGLGNGLRVIFIQHFFFPDHVFFLTFWIAVIIISFCCASVLHALKHSGPVNRKNEMTGHSKTERGRAVESQQKRKAFRIISYILLSILVCYLPQVVTYIAFISAINKETFICNVFPFSLGITVFTLLISPLISMYIEGYLKHIMCYSMLRGQTKDK